MNPFPLPYQYLLALLLAAPLSVFASSFYSFGTTFGAQGLSGDGMVVAGTNPVGEAFYWTAAGGMIAIDSLTPGSSMNPEAVSYDGSVIVGTADDSGQLEAFRWTSGGGTIGLGDLPGGETLSEAFGVSSDGSVVVGRSSSVSGTFQPYYWTSGGGMVGITDAAGDPLTGTATAISGDGMLITGGGDLSGTSSLEAFSWTSSDGLTPLVTLDGTSTWTLPLSASFDGSVIVGQDGVFLGAEAFHWDATNGMVGLGDFSAGGFYSQAADVSADGTRIVGTGLQGDTLLYGSGDTAFLWDAENGMRSIQALLMAQGIDLAGWQLTNANWISDDGTTILGWGYNPDGNQESWLVTLDSVPLPAATWLMASGLIVLLGVGIRRRIFL